MPAQNDSHHFRGGHLLSEWPLQRKEEKQRQGNVCFNFKKIEPDLFHELAALTRKGAEKFKQENA